MSLVVFVIFSRWIALIAWIALVEGWRVASKMWCWWVLRASMALRWISNFKIARCRAVVEFLMDVVCTIYIYIYISHLKWTAPITCYENTSHALQRFQWKALRWIRVETFSLSLGLRWHQTANLMPSWCQQKPRTKSSHHCRTFGHRYFGNLSAWRGKAFRTFENSGDEAFVSSLRSFTGPKWNLGRYFVWTRFASSASKRKRESQQSAFYLWGFSEMKHALYALFLFDPFLRQFVARWLHTTSGKPPGVTSLLVHSTQSPCTLLLLQACPFGFFTKSDALFLSIYNTCIFCGVYRSARHFRYFPWSQHWESTFLTRQPYAYHGPPGCRCANSHIRCVFESNGKTCCESVMLGMWKACLYVSHIVTEVCQVRL